MRKKVYPNTVIGGAPKCGTSSLYFWLAAHPDACGSRVKETFFFADSVSRFNKKLNFLSDPIERYTEHFENCDPESKVIFEATAPYIYYSTALNGIDLLPTKPKVVFVLREPAARLYSKFKFNKYKLKNFHGDFKDYISEDGNLYSGRHFEEGKYINYLKDWLTRFGDNRIRVFEFEKMKSDPVNMMKELCQFLDIDGSFYDDFNFNTRNETVSLKSKGIHQLGLRLQPLIPHKIQQAVLPLYMKLNSGKMPGKTEVEKELIAELREEYKESNRSLKEAFPYLHLNNWSQ